MNWRSKAGLARAPIGGRPSVRLPHGFPPVFTRFVGREALLRQLHRRVADHRLVTLVGPGGAGKTRMVLEAADSLATKYVGGIWFVPLESVSEPALVDHAVATVLQLKSEPGVPFAVAVAEAFGTRPVLLVLDNCEHLIDQCRLLAMELLGACAGVQIIATSRVPLGAEGEALLRVPPLGLPGPKERDPVAIGSTEAVRLLLDRAGLVSPDLKIDPSVLLAMAEICQRLDGLPLALELVAARFSLLSPLAIAQRLPELIRDLGLPSQGHRRRRRNLGDAIAWSYALLSPTDQQVWRSLTILGGSFSIEVAAALCNQPEAALLDALGRLTDHSLLQPIGETDEVRFRLLEVLRQWGREQVRAEGEEPILHARLLDWCVKLAEQAQASLAGPEADTWMGRLDLEQDNLRAALGAACQTEDRRSGLTLAVALTQYWQHRGLLAEGRHWLDRLIGDAPAPTELIQARAWQALGTLAFRQSDYMAAQSRFDQVLLVLERSEDRSGEATLLNIMGAMAREQHDLDRALMLFERSMDRFRSIGDTDRIALVTMNLGSLMHYRGDKEQAVRLGEEAVQLFRIAGNRPRLALALTNLGNTCLWEGDLDAALPLLQESLSLWRQVEDRWGVALATACLGILHHFWGDLEKSRRLQGEALTLRHELGDRHGVIDSVEAIAWIAADSKDGRRAALLLGAAQSQRNALRMPVPDHDRTHYDRFLVRARSLMGERPFAGAWAEGIALRREDAVALALAVPRPVVFIDTPVLPAHPLTDRQVEVLRLVAQGLSSKEIGERLGLSPRTVEKHEENMRTRLDLPNRAALVAWVAQSGLL